MTETKKPRAKPKPPKMVVQHHHLMYEVPGKQREEVVAIRREEHYWITKLNRFRYISKGLIKSLKLFIVMNEDRAIDLESLN